MKNIGFIVILAVLTSIVVSSPSAVIEAKVEWECKTNATTTTCLWGECGVATSDPGKVSLWATGSGDLRGVFYFLQLSGGIPVGQHWTNTSSGNTPVPETSKVDIFESECAQGGALKSLPSEMQKQFRGKYGVPEQPSVPVPVPLRETGLDNLEVQTSK